MRCSKPLYALLLSLLLAGCSQTLQHNTAEPTQQTRSDDEQISVQAEGGTAAPNVELTVAQQKQFAQAKALLLNGDSKAAAELLSSLAQQLPSASGIWYNLAMSQWQNGEVEAAAQTLKQLTTNSPAYSAGHNLAGVLARQQGRFIDAEQHFKLALSASPDNANAHKNLAFLYELYLNKPLQAHYHYKQYFALTGDEQATAWLALLEQQLAQEQTHD